MNTKRISLTGIATLVMILAILLGRGVSNVQASRPNEDRSNASSSSSSVSNEIEVYGPLEAISDTSLTVNGQVIALTAQTEVKNTLAVGQYVKVHLSRDANGNLMAREVEATQAGMTDDYSSNQDGPLHDLNDDHGNDGPLHDINDDHGGDHTTSDDSGTHHQGDDHGGHDGGDDHSGGHH